MEQAARTGHGGRPRSEQARQAVLHAVDDMLVEMGYSAMTMKGIAERAGVGRQTVYRWWSTKAEILLEASVADAREELAIEPTGDARADMSRYVGALIRFLTRSAAGAAYRALIGEAQHDEAVAQLVGGDDVLIDTARAAMSSFRPSAPGGGQRDLTDQAATMLVGSVFLWIISGRDPGTLCVDAIVDACLAVLESAHEAAGSPARF